MTYSKCIYSAAFLLLHLPFAQAQSYFSAQSRGTSAVQGTLVRECQGAGNTPFDNLRVEFSSRQSGNRTYSGDVRWDGGFEVRDVAEGVYEAQVVTVGGGVLKRTLFTSTPMTSHQDFRISVPCADKPVSGSVSIRRLSHKAPKAAVKALRKAGDAQRKGRMEEWERYLRLATSIDPEYFEARNNLGAFLVRTGRPAEALPEFRAAQDLDPNSAPVLNNISACLLSLERAKDAEEFARRALALDPLSPHAHYLIGVALLKQNRFTEEAADHLHDSGSAIPKALEVEAAVRERIRRQTGE